MGRDATRDPASAGAVGAARPTPGGRSVAPRGRVAALALGLGLAVLLAACGGSGGATTAGETAPSGASGEVEGDDSAAYGPAEAPQGGGELVEKVDRSDPGDRSDRGTPGPSGAGAHRVEEPGPVKRPLWPDDLLIYSQESLPDGAAEKIAGMEGVVAVEQLSMSNVAVEDRVITVAAVDPASYRRFTPSSSAQLQEVWERVAGGELAINPRLGKRLQGEKGYITLGNDEGAPRVHIGAYARQSLRVDAVVNPTWADDLGMTEGNALLVSTFKTAPQVVRGPIQKLLGDKASVQILGPDLDTSVQQTAVLTGGSVATAVGSFGYQVLGGGRVQPDSSWVSANIRTEEVPILGTVTCHRAMLNQLRAALTEVARRGLADRIHPEEYAGCYYPRFIAGTTQLSLHSFGIALDMNVPGNQRGTAGEFDRTVVSIFKRWGFAWGGDWGYTDPMHFELARLVEAG